MSKLERESEIQQIRETEKCMQKKRPRETCRELTSLAILSFSSG